MFPVSGVPVSGLLTSAPRYEADVESAFSLTCEPDFLLNGGAPIEGGGFRYDVLAEALGLLEFGGAADVLANLAAHALCAGSFGVSGKFLGALGGGVNFVDAVSTAWSMLLEDAATADDTVGGTVRKLSAIADILNATGIASGSMMARAAVAVAAALEARVSAGWSATAVDQAALVEEARSALLAIMSAADGAAASDTAACKLRMLILTLEGATLADDPVSSLHAFDDLGDNASLFCTLRLGGTDYQGWVLNTQLRAVTEYRNVPFDSFAILRGRTYAAGDGGVFELAGDTDDGQPIDAWFRPFLTNFGTQKMKRVTDIWLGSSEIGLFVKVHTRDPATGQMSEDIYPVQYSHGDGTDKGRVKVGRGLRSNWWTLTVANVEGAQFEVNSIEWKPLVLDRRQ